MSYNYPKLTTSTMEKLPVDKQAEVYDFAEFLETKARKHQPHRAKKASFRDLVGLGRSGKSDISVNHDKYLYERQ
jgi:cytochrome c